MLKNTKIAFYAPIKPPDHPIASGDRLIAQNLIKALELTHAKVELASKYIAYSKRYDESILHDRKSGAVKEATRIIDLYRSGNKKDLPDIWVTYHPYCKAPDWIGPLVSEALDIPRVTIEAARTGQGGAEDLWKPWREEAQQGIQCADLHLVFKPTDHVYLSWLLGGSGKLHSLAPFIDAENTQLQGQAILPDHFGFDRPTLVTTGMMRRGKKVQNFEILAEALNGVNTDYNLVIIGGGPEEQTVRQAFSFLNPAHIYWTGILEQNEVLQWMRAGDIFVWPGWKEPIGMVYLEAQLQQLPVIAYDSMGVPLVVKNGETGLLSQEGDVPALRKSLSILLDNRELRERMGLKARENVLSSHGIHAAAKRLGNVLSTLL